MNELSVFTRSTMLDPRICNIGHDANALDRNGSPRDALVDRFRTLTSAGRLTVVVAGGVRYETEHPHTPADVQDAVLPRIFNHGQVRSLRSVTIVAALRPCCRAMRSQANTRRTRLISRRRPKPDARISSRTIRGFGEARRASPRPPAVAKHRDIDEILRGV